MRKLTAKQQRFVDAWDGNVRTTALAAGYTYQSARQLVTKAHIKAAIGSRSEQERKPTIANREQRQQFWSDVMHDEEQSMKDRLRAGELLGKSEADFTEKIQQDTTLTVVRKTYGT